MKKILLTAVLLVSCLMFKAEAQIKINLGINIGSQPDWGPVGYDHAEYYYIPDQDFYYDVPNHQYVYFQNNAWVHAAVLPARYHFDPYNSYKVVINDRNPWERETVYRKKYASYKGRRNQVIIRDSKEVKYRDHWKGDGRGPGNSDYGHDKGAHGRGHDNHGHDDHGHH